MTEELHQSTNYSSHCWKQKAGSSSIQAEGFDLKTEKREEKVTAQNGGEEWRVAE